MIFIFIGLAMLVGMFLMIPKINQHGYVPRCSVCGRPMAYNVLHHDYQCAVGHFKGENDWNQRR